ncbi:MAG: NYN domain-containing protein [Candidatus Eisenbacteria sp.]|nr:NYN domain-containing protein [Candidatus Eisenbacteria bacterium]
MELIVDGYNVIHGVPELRAVGKHSLADARNQLERRLARYRASRRGVGVLLYWDGDSDVVPGGPERVQGITVVFARSSADSAIVGRVKASGSPGQITVVTDDRALARAAKNEGAGVIPVDRLAKWLTEVTERSPGKLRPDRGVGKEITDELKDVWGTD